jgi:flagellar assembly protein FliH
MSSSKSNPPGGGQGQGGGAPNAYARFIPREELGAFAAWSPDTLNAEPDASCAAPAPAAGTAQPSPQGQGAPQTPQTPQAQLAAARQAGYQDGYRDGLSALEGFKQSFAGQMSAQVGQLLQGIDQGFQALEASMAQAVAAATVELARQVLRSELATRPEAVARVATEAVGAVLLSARHVTLHLHPKDLPLVAASEADAEALAARGTRLVAPEGLARGGCRVESDLGVIDARIGERWAQAAATLGVDLPWTDGPDDHA